MFVNGAEVIPPGSVSWLHAFGDVNSAQKQAFATFGQSFTTYGVPLAQDSALIDAGFARPLLHRPVRRQRAGQRNQTDLPLMFHPAVIRASAVSVTPFGVW